MFRRDARKILIHDIRSDDHRFELRPVEECLNIVQRNSAQEPAFFVNYIDVLESVLHESLCDLCESRILRQSYRVAADQILKVDLSQLPVKKRSALSFERLAIHEISFENAAAIVGDHAVHHQKRSDRIV